MGIVINNISYARREESNTTFVEIPKEGQTVLKESQESINSRNYNLSVRNGANAYIIPVDQEKVYLNFIGQKTIVYDSDISNILKPEFEFFIDEIIPEVDPFVLADGMIFRCASASSLPKNKEDYVYYIMMGGEAKKIPNYKTLEVMLAERNQTLLSVRVLEENQCADIVVGSPISNKSSSWVQDFADQTSLEALRELENNAKSAKAIADGAKANAQGQIDAVKAQAAADAAAADAAKAQADAANASAQAAIAQAAAAQAAAEAAKAEADARAAEAGGS